MQPGTNGMNADVGVEILVRSHEIQPLIFDHGFPMHDVSITGQ